MRCLACTTAAGAMQQSLRVWVRKFRSRHHHRLSGPRPPLWRGSPSFSARRAARFQLRWKPSSAQRAGKSWCSRCCRRATQWVALAASRETSERLRRGRRFQRRPRKSAQMEARIASGLHAAGSRRPVVGANFARATRVDPASRPGRRALQELLKSGRAKRARSPRGWPTSDRGCPDLRARFAASAAAVALMATKVAPG